ncbi:MAG: glycosyltransferase family 2 protein [Candidatus Latescibacterota bacterium]
MSNIVLSAVVLSQNEEKNLPRCLDSLRFADEVLVVDAMSEDSSATLARAHGARVIQQQWMGFAKQWQFAVDHAKGDWVLLCAADEEVSEGLADEMRRTLLQPGNIKGYWVPRQSQFLGRWMRHGPWADDCQLRLFRKSHGGIAERAVHEGVVLSGDAGRLANLLYHYTHQTISDSVLRLNRYTTLEAGDRAGRRRIGVLDFVFSPLSVFLKYYLCKGCWRAGIHGFLLSAITAMYKSVLYIKIYFLQRSRRPGNDAS